MPDLFLEIIRAMLVSMILIYLWIVGGKEEVRHKNGWHFIVAGFGLILFGMLIDITDNFPSLNHYIIIGDTPYQAFLKKVVGYLFGFILVVVGFWKWMPIIIRLRKVQKELQKSHDELGVKIHERTAELNLSNQKLQKEIDESKRYEKALQESNERMEAILFSLPVGIMIIDAETQEIVDANPYTMLMIGAPLELIVGSKYHQFICPLKGDIFAIADMGQSAAKSGYELYTASGKKVPIHLSVVTVSINSRKCLIGGFADVSEQKALEQERIQKEKFQGVIEMAGAICHELNQPLQVVSGYSELVMMDIKDDNPIYNKIKRIKNQVIRMGDITQKLMGITRYETKDYLDGKIIDIEKATR